MMSIFSFKVRSPHRDMDTDETRYGRLTSLLQQLSSEIGSERAGLGQRYNDAVTNAGFLMDAVENDDATENSAEQVKKITETIRAYEARMKNLTQQIEFIGELRSTVADFRKPSPVG